MTDSRPAGLPRPVPLLIAASLALSLFVALRFPLLDPDEGRNAEVAREMAVSGDMVIPHLAGMPYLDKPPLLFALGAAAIRVLGPTPLAARLPAMLASLVTLLLLARAARDLAPPGRAASVVALTAAAPLFAALSAYVIFDMPLTACVTAVWTLLAVELARGPSAERRAAMFAAVALGVLAKGPIMLMWAAGGSACAALLSRSRGPVRWLEWGPGWLVVLAVAGGWFALALRRHPEYAHYAFLEESLERMTSKSFKRDQPWWFVPAVLAGGALPWSLATPWRAPRDAASRVAAGFVLFAAIFFSLSHSKLVTYLLPAVPAMAWWAAECWDVRAGGLPRPLRAALLLSPLLLVGGSPWLGRYAEDQSGRGLAAALTGPGGATARFEDCYSPGSEYLMGRSLAVVSATGDVLTSNYVVRYRNTLRQRGLWRLYDRPETAPPARVIVVPARHASDRRGTLGEPFYVDRRFAAFRLP